jgi:Leucine-rich repeat (LRR) protein
MPAATDTPPPRRNWHLARWFLVLTIAVFGWSGWQAYAFRSALKEAKALGWEVRYTDPVETIRENWKLAFEKETWLDGVTYLDIPKGESFTQNLTILHRLNPRVLRIADASPFRDLSSLKSLTRLRSLALIDCTGLTNVDALENLAALEDVRLNDGTLLTNVDAIKNLSALHTVILSRCTGLTNVEGLNNLSNLQRVVLRDCTGLTNVDGLKNLSALQGVWLEWH